MSGRIWYFCHLCDSYSEGVCRIFDSTEQERHIDKGFCNSAAIYTRVVEMQMQYVKINGQTFRKGSGELNRILEVMRKLGGKT